MTILIGGYAGARSCTSGPTVGCKNLTAFHLELNGGRGGTNLGIYNCRTVRGGTTTSLHGEGRASDLGTPVGNSWSWDFVDWLRQHSAELGIQCIIHNRKIWSSSGGTGWRNYSGVAAHFDHAHVELTWAAANGGLTVQKLRDLWAATHSGGGSGGGSTPARAGDGILERGDKGDAVRTLQRVLNRWYPNDVRLTEDGDFGPATEAAVKYAQGRFRVTQDGVAGPVTLGKLGLAGLR